MSPLSLSRRLPCQQKKTSFRKNSHSPYPPRQHPSLRASNSLTVACSRRCIDPKRDRLSMPSSIEDFQQALTCKLPYRLVLWPSPLAPTRHLPGPIKSYFLMSNFAMFKKNRSVAPQAIRVRTIPNSGLLRYLRIFNSERIPHDAGVLKEVLQIEGYGFIKPPLVTNDIGNTLGKKGLLFAEGESPRYGGSCCCRLSRACTLMD